MDYGKWVNKNCKFAQDMQLEEQCAKANAALYDLWKILQERNHEQTAQAANVYAALAELIQSLKEPPVPQ